MSTTQTTEKAEAHTAEQSAKHTPGPWWNYPEESDGRMKGYIRDAKGVAVCRVSNTGRDYNEYHANARLIAAAPELLEALKFLQSQVRQLAARAFSEGVEEWLAKCDAMNCANHAIAKAESGECAPSVPKGNENHLAAPGKP